MTCLPPQDDAHFNSHNRIGDFDLYLDQIEDAINIMKSDKDYDTKVIGYTEHLSLSTISRREVTLSSMVSFLTHPSLIGVQMLWKVH